MNINNLKHIDMKTLKIIRLIAKVTLLVVPAIVCSIYSLIFGSDNGRLMDVYFNFHSLFSID